MNNAPWNGNWKPHIYLLNGRWWVRPSIFQLFGSRRETWGRAHVSFPTLREAVIWAAIP